MKAEAKLAALRDVLIHKGFVECDIPACNCGSWHHRYGLPERWAEIKELLCYAEVLNNDTGNTPLNAIKKLISQLAERDAEIARLRQFEERYRWLRSQTSIGDSRFFNMPKISSLNFTPGTGRDYNSKFDSCIDNSRKAKT